MTGGSIINGFYQADGYYQAPNTAIPHNKRDPGTIAQIAADQLRAYQSAADGWPVYKKDGDRRTCNRCRACDQNIWFTADTAGRMYKYSRDEIRALITAHVRQVHADMVNPDGTVNYTQRDDTETWM